MKRWGGPVWPRGGSRCIPLLRVSIEISGGALKRVLTMPVKDVEAIDHHIRYLEVVHFRAQTRLAGSAQIDKASRRQASAGIMTRRMRGRGRQPHDQQLSVCNFS